MRLGLAGAGDMPLTLRDVVARRAFRLSVGGSMGLWLGDGEGHGIMLKRVHRIGITRLFVTRAPERCASNQPPEEESAM